MFVGTAGFMRVDVFVPSIPFFEQAKERRVRSAVVGLERDPRIESGTRSITAIACERSALWSRRWHDATCAVVRARAQRGTLIDSSIGNGYWLRAPRIEKFAAPQGRARDAALDRGLEPARQLLRHIAHRQRQHRQPDAANREAHPRDARPCRLRNPLNTIVTSAGMLDQSAGQSIAQEPRREHGAEREICRRPAARIGGRAVARVVRTRPVGMIDDA
jgi:hypothetical protein